MATIAARRSSATRAALLEGALEEFAAFGYRRASMEGVARRADVSRATLYLHWKGKEALFKALVESVHAEHLAAMEAVLAREHDDLASALTEMLEAGFVRFVALTSASAHASELYDRHDRLCGDIARASQERSELLIAKLIRKLSAAGLADLAPSGLSAPRVAGVLFDCARGAKGEDPSAASVERFQRRLREMVRVLCAGLDAPR